MSRFFIVLFTGILLLSCSASKYMTYDDYHKIAIGESIADVQVQLGRPYEVKELAPHKQEYIYIERISLGDKREIFRRYILSVDHEKITDKKVSEEVTSPIQFIGA